MSAASPGAGSPASPYGRTLCGESAHCRVTVIALDRCSELVQILALVDRTHRTQTTTFCDEPSLSGAGVLDRDGGNIAVDCGRGVPKPPTSPTLVSRAVSNPSLPLMLGERARSAAAAPRSMIEPVLNERSSTLASTSDVSVSTLRMASAARAAALARNAASDGLKTSESLLALERIEGVRERLD